MNVPGHGSLVALDIVPDCIYLAGFTPASPLFIYLALGNLHIRRFESPFESEMTSSSILSPSHDSHEPGQ